MENIEHLVAVLFEKRSFDNLQVPCFKAHFATGHGLMVVEEVCAVAGLLLASPDYLG